jgi:hypothetical protein
MQIGITERGDAGLDTSWLPWVTSGKPAILITKAPEKVYRELNELKIYEKPMNVIVHCTITGLGGSVYEPNVEPWEKTISWYYTLQHLLGRDRVVLRVDPIILYGSKNYENESAVKTAREIYSRRDGRVRISFFDNYPHVMRKFKKAGVGVPPYYMHAPLSYRQEIKDKLFSEVEVCGEPGMACAGCVSSLDLRVFAPEIANYTLPFSKQRPACTCLAMKYELLSNKHPCGHNCLYCYWKDK